ncbi:hypothetical protein B2J86_13805 [Acidovorax sp. SRB_14]|uniref:hypothetical protein n=1 Tax=unclassified Acidovorax TaxID=2684926 RepID=UPI00145FAFAC|nr:MULTISPECIES: hypothetical protein [unclassified Acidovorax]NMM78191.1 hypothetical protein [Acidovorax sp. SRB_24]NMM81987.1 hypothetical protein [Acidovorax sp. SRB_14]
MSIEYLQQLASDGTFPVDVTDEAKIDTLRILKAAGMVEVQLPDGDRSHACVHAITGKGRAAMLAEIANQVIARRSADVESALRIRV